MTPSALTVLENFYADLAKGKEDLASSSLPDAMTFAVAGKSQLAGKYTKETFFKSYIAKLKEFSGGSLKVEIHDVLTSDRHGTVLLTYSIGNGDKLTQLRAVHVWRIENGKPVAGYEYPRDMYQYDTIWSS